MRRFSSHVKAVFEKAIFESLLTTTEKREMGVAFLDFMNENASNVAQVKEVQARLRKANILQASAAVPPYGIGTGAAAASSSNPQHQQTNQT